MDSKEFQWDKNITAALYGLGSLDKKLRHTMQPQNLICEVL